MHSEGCSRHMSQGRLRLDDEMLVVGRSNGSLRAFRSVLAGHPTEVQYPNDVLLQRSFKIRAAESTRERRSANRLVGQMYATRGYESTPLPEGGSPLQKTFLASDHNTVIGTLTIGLDSSDGLFVDDLFPDEVGRIRDAGLHVCEFTKLAMDRRARSPRLLAALFHVAYIYAHRIKALHNLLIEVNPRHVRYYQTMLGFKAVGEVRHNTRVNAPAVLLSLDLDHAQEQIARFGGRPELASAERSAYPHFFSARDEHGIVGRLQRTDEDIAHVFEPRDRASVPHHLTGELH